MPHEFPAIVLLVITAGERAQRIPPPAFPMIVLFVITGEEEEQ